jgi:transmembrane sensor
MMLAHPPLRLWPSWSELRADYRTEPGDQRWITLANQVSIELNTRTSVAVRSAEGQVQGIELISGEAAIATGQEAATRFVAVAGNGRAIGAAGARFNLLNEDQAVCVTCIEGQVGVEHGGLARALRGGQQVRYSDGSMSETAFIDPAVVTAWQNGIVIFQSTPVSQVIAEVNRYRSGRVILVNKTLGGRLFNARLRIENIDRVINQIAEVFDARVTKFPAGVVLLG